MWFTLNDSIDSNGSKLSVRYFNSLIYCIFIAHRANGTLCLHNDDGRLNVSIQTEWNGNTVWRECETETIRNLIRHQWKRNEILEIYSFESDCDRAPELRNKSRSATDKKNNSRNKCEWKKQTNNDTQWNASATRECANKPPQWFQIDSTVFKSRQHAKYERKKNNSTEVMEFDNFVIDISWKCVRYVRHGSGWLNGRYLHIK